MASRAGSGLVFCLEFPGATRHVTFRGDCREPIYRDDTNRAAQWQVIGAAINRFEAKALA